ncbi:MAG: hypothetical protein WD533_08650 [Dehalococcoidia bacterium]
MDKRNVTITLDEDVADWVRVEAAKHRMSVSRFLGEQLREQMETSPGRSAAKRRLFSRPPAPLKDSNPMPRREDIHDRPVFR